MRSEKNDSPYLSGIVRDGLQPFRYRGGVMRLLGIPEPGSSIVGSCHRLSPTMKYSVFPTGSRMHPGPEMCHRDTGDSAGVSSMPRLKTDEEQTVIPEERQTSRLQQEHSGHDASGEDEQLLPEGRGNSSQSAAAVTENGLQTEKHCIDPKEEHDRLCANLRSLPPGLEPAGRASPAGPFHPGTGEPHDAERHPGTSGKRGIPDAGGAAGCMARPVLAGGYKEVDLSSFPEAQAHRVPDLTSIVPRVAGEIRPLSVDDRDDGSLARGKTRDIPNQEFPAGRRPHVLRSSKQRDRMFSEDLRREDSYNPLDDGEYRVADERRATAAYLTALRKDRPFSEGGSHTQRGTHTARTEERPPHHVAPAVQPQQVVIVRQQSAPVYETAAFWERSYLSRLRLRSLR